MAEDRNEAKAIGPSTKVSLSAAAAVFAAVLGVGWALAGKLATIDLRLQNLESRNDGSTIASLIERIAQCDVNTLDLERRLAAIERSGPEPCRASAHVIEDRIRTLEEFNRRAQAEQFTSRDMDLWIEHARARQGLGALPDRPRN